MKVLNFPHVSLLAPIGASYRVARIAGLNAFKKIKFCFQKFQKKRINKTVYPYIYELATIMPLLL
jgi:hypothetical protein